MASSPWTPRQWPAFSVIGPIGLTTQGLLEANSDNAVDFIVLGRHVEPARVRT